MAYRKNDIQTTTTAMGDLSGTFGSTTVAKINGVTISGAPTINQVLTAGSATTASWQAASKGRTATLSVAASNSSVASKAAADYVCTGTAATGGDEVTINSAITALAGSGGKIMLLEGTYWCSNPIIIDSNELTLEGQGWGFATSICIANNASRTAAIIIGNTQAASEVSIRFLSINGGVNGGSTIQASSGHGIYSCCGKLLVEGLNIGYLSGDGIHMTGVPAAGPSGTLSSALTAGSPITSLPVNALGTTIPAGTLTIYAGGNYQTFTTTGAASGATSVPITSQSPNYAFTSGTTVAASGNTYDCTVFNVYIRIVQGNGLFADPSINSCEFVLVRSKGNAAVPTSTPTGASGFYLLGTYMKFLLCHPYFWNHGYSIGNPAGGSSPQNIEIIGGECESSYSDGMLTYGVKNLLINSVLFYDNGTSGSGAHINTELSTQYVMITNCQTYPSTYVPPNAVYIGSGASDISILNNHFTDSSATHCIATTTSVTVPTRIRIRGNQFALSGSATSCINLGAATYSEVAENVMNASVIESTGADYSRIWDNHFTNGSITLVGTHSAKWMNVGIADMVYLSTTSYTLYDRDRLVLDAVHMGSPATATITTPPSGVQSGYFDVVRQDTASGTAITLAAASACTINGVASITIGAASSATLPVVRHFVLNGTNWVG